MEILSGAREGLKSCEKFDVEVDLQFCDSMGISSESDFDPSLLPPDAFSDIELLFLENGDVEELGVVEAPGPMVRQMRGGGNYIFIA
jgi:hypothetical protein